jgi:hypothetical protein
MTTPVAPSLSDEDLRRLLPLLGSADSIELKLTVPAAARSVLQSLELDPLDAVIRQVFFFDTPDLTLDNHGLVVRARRTQGRPDDSTVKLRPVDPANLDPALRKVPEFVVEIDTMPGGFVCSASYKGTLGSVSVREVVAAGKSIKKLFSKPQREFFHAHAPDGLKLDDLSVLGPVTTFKLNAVPPGLGRKLVGELWQYPDGNSVVELSTKCKPAKAFEVAAQGRAFLEERGVPLDSAQQTKTHTALEYFAGVLRAEAGSGA